MEITAVKIGGSAITDKGEKFSVKENTLKQIAEELAPLEEKFVLIHGGGSFGHPVASKYDISSGYSSDEQLLGFSKTHSAMEELNSKVIDAFLKAGRPVITMQTSALTVVENDEINSLKTKNMRKLLELGITPVLYGDCVPDLKKGMSILSGDQLITSLAQKLEANKVVLGTDINGVFTSDPRKIEDAELIPKITPENWESLKSSIEFPAEKDVTGGMENKVKALLDLAKEEGIESQIVNATKRGMLKRAIRSDKGVGTNITRG